MIIIKIIILYFIQNHTRTDDFPSTGTRLYDTSAPSAVETMAHASSTDAAYDHEEYDNGAYDTSEPPSDTTT